MSDTSYTIDAWEDSFGSAEESNFIVLNEFKREDPLAEFLCEQHSKNSNVSDDPEILLAVINILASFEYESFSMNQFTGVLQSFRGKTGNDFKVLVEDYARENGDDSLGELVRHGISDEYAEHWYLKYNINEGDEEVFIDTDTSDSFYWFAKAKWGF